MSGFVNNSNAVESGRYAVWACVLLSLLFSDAPGAQGNAVKSSRFALGTSVTVILDTGDIAKQEVIFDAVFNEIDRLERLLSSYRYDSQLSQLNRNGSIACETGELKEVINESRRFSMISKGAFDVTVKPITDLMHICHLHKRRRPTDEEMRRAFNLVGFQGIKFGKGKIVLQKRGMGVTLDGIAKGYIIDRAIEILVRNGISRALVNVGGDIRVIGERALNEPWKVALQHPRDDESYIAVVELKNQAIATSGDYTQYFFSDRSAHHIVDPRTGLSAVGLISATVVADRAIDADALATSVFVLGQVEGIELVERLPRTEALIITEARRIHTSSGFGEFAYVPSNSSIVRQPK